MRAPIYILLLSLVGCDQINAIAEKVGGEAEKSAGNAEPAEIKKIEIEWDDEDSFVVVGSPEKKGEVAIHEGTYQVTLHGFREGTKWEAGEKKGKVDSDVYGVLEIVAVEDRFGALPVTEPLKLKVDPELTLTVTQPSGEQFEVELPAASAVSSVEHALKRIENGPVLFGEEPKKDDAPNENVLFLGSTLDWSVFGKATKLSDIDTVAVAHRLPDAKGKKTCSGYKDNGGKPMPDLDIYLKETEVKVYERRTGDVVDKKVFPPDDECPMFAFRRADDDKPQDSFVPTQEIESWLRARVGR